MTLSEIKELVRAQLEEESAALYSDANIIAWANDAERDIAAKTKCIREFLALATVANTREINLLTGLSTATSFYKVHYVEIYLSGTVPISPPIQYDILWYDGEIATPTDISWYDTTDVLWVDNLDAVSTKVKPPETLIQTTPDHMYHTPNRAQTYPQYWFQWGNYIYLDPVPDDAYTLRAYVSRSPNDQMAVDADEPEIPLEFQQAIIPYVVMIGKLKARKFGDAGVKYGEYIGFLQNNMSQYITMHPITLPEIRLQDSVVIK
jgi:hypothetical protein